MRDGFCARAGDPRLPITAVCAFLSCGIGAARHFSTYRKRKSRPCPPVHVNYRRQADSWRFDRNPSRGQREHVTTHTNTSKHTHGSCWAKRDPILNVTILGCMYNCVCTPTVRTCIPTWLSQLQRRSRDELGRYSCV